MLCMALAGKRSLGGDIEEWMHQTKSALAALSLRKARLGGVGAEREAVAATPGRGSEQARTTIAKGTYSSMPACSPDNHHHHV